MLVSINYNFIYSYLNTHVDLKLFFNLLEKSTALFTGEVKKWNYLIIEFLLVCLNAGCTGQVKRSCRLSSGGFM